MIAGAPQRLAASPRGKPTDGCKNEEKLFVGTPGQHAGDLFRHQRGMAGNSARDGDIRFRRPDVDRKTRRAAKTMDSAWSVHVLRDRKCRYIFKRAIRLPGPSVAPAPDWQASLSEALRREPARTNAVV